MLSEAGKDLFSPKGILTQGAEAKEKMGELLFALRSKTGWKKGKGAAGL